MRIAFYSNRNSSVTVIGYSCRNSFFLAGGRKKFFTGELSAFCVEFDTVDFAIIHNDFIIISRNPNIVAASIISALVKPCFCVVIQGGGLKAQGFSMKEKYSKVTLWWKGYYLNK